ncbi:MAG: DUF2225 domain-containing protein, partial [Lachnospiraceae bacterium]|nr:DUF2225 domain-containing protein [Lachnospiraceae bacterium]
GTIMETNEKTLLIDKKYTCPICETQLRAKAVKSNSARFVDTKADLRPIHSNINVTKYDAVCCPHCGFAALTKNFTSTTQTQRKLIHDKIQANYKAHEETECDFYTTEMAISRMKMALLCTISKEAKDSEIGNVCLKISWLYQDLADELPEDAPDAAAKKELYLKEADNAAMKAYERLTNARTHESYPIAGMNETTLDYLLAYFAYKKGEYQTAMQFLSGVVSNRSTSPRLKDKALDLKDLINQAKEQ